MINKIHALGYFLALSTLLLFSSCEEDLKVSLEDIEPQLVVEGWIYNIPGPYEVKLSLTQNYFDSLKAKKIEDATVVIVQDNILFDTLKMISPGKYITQKILLGKINATYKLRILWNAQIFEAISTLSALATLDSITFFRDIERNKERFFPSVHFQDPPNIGNFYLFYLFRNGKIQSIEEDTYDSDNIFNGQYISKEINENLDAGDTAIIVMKSTDVAGYNFFKGLIKLSQNSNLLSAPPSNSIGNISNGAFGFFGASSITTAQKVVE